MEFSEAEKGLSSSERDDMVTKSSATTRVALYARVSTSDQGQTADNQLLALRELAARQGWQVVAEFVDESSGARSDRPALRAMLEAASQRRFDLLLFWSLDRLSRQGALKTLELLDQLSPLWRRLAQLHGAVSGLGRAVWRGAHRAAGVAGAAGAAADPGAGAGGAGAGPARGQAAGPAAAGV